MIVTICAQTKYIKNIAPSQNKKGLQQHKIIISTKIESVKMVLNRNPTKPVDPLKNLTYATLEKSCGNILPFICIPLTIPKIMETTIAIIKTISKTLWRLQQAKEFPKTR